MEIKASEVKTLREKTGAGMMECKKALVECEGNAGKAEKLLKEKGLAAVEKRADRATSEGRIFIKNAGNRVIIAELTCETDFVAKNADFIAVGDAILDRAMEKGYTAVNEELSNMLLDLATKIRENMSLRRLEAIDIGADQIFAKYVHSDGKSGVVVVLKADKPEALANKAVKDFAYDCCLHIAAFAPKYICSDDVDSAYIEEQKEIFTKQAAELDKPDNVKAGIVQGKIKKHLADICFLDQPFVKDDKVSVSQKMEQAGKEAGAKLSLSKVVFYQLGA
ncbi:MAG: translation elongation factor Ts [Spirochaetaceae bacterium]|jgi:elongation factor Ts|nr:translation elongation factor Ts [Spirochaetaceae bacterium]